MLERQMEVDVALRMGRSTRHVILNWIFKGAKINVMKIQSVKDTIKKAQNNVQLQVHQVMSVWE